MPHHAMLGRSIGIGDDMLAHLADEILPDGLYSEPEAAIIRYAQKSTRMEPIDQATYQALAQQFSVQQMIDICFVVGLANMANRFNATFLTEVDDHILAANEQAAQMPGACPIRYPPLPA
jgi:alkylhydroperoxidase family enzyme